MPCHYNIDQFCSFLSISKKGEKRQTKNTTHSMCILSFWCSGIHKNFSKHFLFQKVERVPHLLPLNPLIPISNTVTWLSRSESTKYFSSHKHYGPAPRGYFRCQMALLTSVYTREHHLILLLMPGRHTSHSRWKNLKAEFVPGDTKG